MPIGRREQNNKTNETQRQTNHLGCNDRPTRDSVNPNTNCIENQTYLCSLELRYTHQPISTTESISIFRKHPQHGFLRISVRTGADVGIGTGGAVVGEGVSGAVVGGDAVVGEGVVASEQLSVNGRLGSCLLSPVVTSFQKDRDKQAEGTAGWMPVLHDVSTYSDD